VLRSHLGHQPDEIGAEIRRLVEELVDLREQQRKASSKEDEVVSRLYVALGYVEHSTQRSLFKDDKLSSWADSAGAYSPDNNTLRPRKRARVRVRWVDHKCKVNIDEFDKGATLYSW
jgi:hypothetical protein